MIDSLIPAAGLPQTEPDQAEAVAHAEGRAALELLRTLGDKDWGGRPTAPSGTCAPWSPTWSPSAKTASTWPRWRAGSC